MARMRLKRFGENILAEGEFFDIHKEISVGRDSKNGIVISSGEVSRHQCLISLDQYGNVFVADLNSRNGTFVNGKRVTRIQVHPNDVLQIGSERFKFILAQENKFEKDESDLNEDICDKTVIVNLEKGHSSAHVHAEDQRDQSVLSDTLQELPSYITRGLLYITIIFACLALLWSIVSKIDIVSSVNSNLIPGGMMKITQPYVSGNIENIIIKEGEFIKKGQSLVTVISRTKTGIYPPPPYIEAGFYDTQKNLKMTLKLKNIKKKIQMEDDSFVLKKQKYTNNAKKQDELVKRAILEIEISRSDLNLQEHQVNANEELFKEQLISKISLLESQKKRESALLRLKISESALASVKETREITNREFEEEKNEHKKILHGLEEQLDQVKVAMAQLEPETEQNEEGSNILSWNMEKDKTGLKQRPAFDTEGTGGNMQTHTIQITSPMDGTVKQLLIRSEGEAVTPGQTLMFVALNNLSLIAELKIPNKDIGLVKAGQIVKFKFDAFPSAEYGAIHGDLISILNAPEIEDKDKDGKPYYRAIATLEQDYFRVKGEEVKLVTGMTAKAEIVTNQKSLLSLFLKPIMKLRKTKDAQK